MTLYLAYGSNLNKAAMQHRCPGARPVGTIMLTHARLVFRGVADVELVNDPNSIVPCGLWEITEENEKQLDRYEGVANGMYKRVWLPLSEGRRALIYMMDKDQYGIRRPWSGYVQTIKDGYRDFFGKNKHLKILEDAVDRSFDEVPTEQTESRRKRQKKNGQRDLVEMPKKTRARKLIDYAFRAIEKYIGDVAPDIAELPEEKKSAALSEEAYCLALDALINVQGVTDEEAAKIAKKAAASFEF